MSRTSRYCAACVEVHKYSNEYDCKSILKRNCTFSLKFFQVQHVDRYNRSASNKCSLKSRPLHRTTRLPLVEREKSDIWNQFSSCNKKKPAVCEVVKTDFGVAAGQNAFGKRLGQLRDIQK